ncbi:MAG TPA: hypothetical protein VL854_06270 [Nitrososphaeraceae archaeon]|nr:hypothetical protein [Nitrososphaeraceae archaeon]
MATLGIELYVAAIYSIIVGGAAGVFASIVSWAAGNESFNGRKMFVAISAGIGSGILAAMLEVTKLKDLGLTEIDPLTLLFTLVTIFTTAGFGAFTLSKLGQISEKGKGEVTPTQ